MKPLAFPCLVSPPRHGHLGEGEALRLPTRPARSDGERGSLKGRRTGGIETKDPICPRHLILYVDQPPRTGRGTTKGEEEESFILLRGAGW